MLPQRLSSYLRYLAGLATQPANRWEGFDQSAPEARETSLRGQIAFAGYALAALAAHPSAGPDEGEAARGALAHMADRLIQRRVWAGWAGETERAGLKPDPVEMGYGAYTGALAMLLGLQARLSGSTRYDHEPLTLRWSADARYSYTAGELAELLWRQVRASPDGAITCEGDLAHGGDMAAVLWALRLHDLAGGGGDYGSAGAAWLATLGGKMAIRGPRLPGRGALAGSYGVRARRASLGGDSLGDAWALAMTAPLDRGLVARLAERHWPGLPKICARGEHLAAAFSYLLAVELGEAGHAEALLAYAEERLGPQDDEEGGRRYAGAPAAPWVTALYAIGEAGGLSRLLGPAAPAPPAP